MKIREIVGALEEFAPLSLQDSFDNAGLQIGLTEDVEATGALLCLDVTEEVLDEAICKGCNIVVSHHPLLFRPCKSITGADYIERCVIKAIKNEITIYSAHTNLDNAKNGVNYRMASKLGLTCIEVLDSKGNNEGIGAGVVGLFSEPMNKEDFIVHVKKVFDAECIRFNSWIGEKIKRVALCGGAGAFLIGKAAAAGVDAFLTGEVGYHRFFGHENELLLVEIGHYESEQYTLEILREIIEKTAPLLPVFNTRVETNPINYI